MRRLALTVAVTSLLVACSSHDRAREQKDMIGSIDGGSVAPPVATAAADKPYAAAPAAAPAVRAKTAMGPGSAFGVAGNQEPGPVKAGEWDDNANYREFGAYLASQKQVPFLPLDASHRRFLVVRDRAGKAVPGCAVQVAGENNTVSYVTEASGRALFLPRAEGINDDVVRATAKCVEGSASASLKLTDDDGLVDLRLDAPRRTFSRSIDVAFVLDTTGSMAEEIAAMKSTIQKVATTFASDDVSVRIGLVEYKDRSDPFVTKAYPMTSDLAAFSRNISGIQASGGGDLPEAMNQGIHAGLNDLEFNDHALAKLVFVIADAPPHLDYQGDFDYRKEALAASHRGIQMFPVAASGMDALGQAVFRQIAEATSGQSMFVLRGGAGPQSTGGGDPTCSTGGTQTKFTSGHLDALVVAKIRAALAAPDADPLKIPGLGKDQDPTPAAVAAR